MYDTHSSVKTDTFPPLFFVLSLVCVAARQQAIESVAALVGKRIFKTEGEWNSLVLSLSLECYLNQSSREKKSRFERKNERKEIFE